MEHFINGFGVPGMNWFLAILYYYLPRSNFRQQQAAKGKITNTPAVHCKPGGRTAPMHNFVDKI
jgi:hypothetical protein